MVCKTLPGPGPQPLFQPYHPSHTFLLTSHPSVLPFLGWTLLPAILRPPRTLLPPLRILFCLPARMLLYASMTKPKVPHHSLSQLCRASRWHLSRLQCATILQRYRDEPSEQRGSLTPPSAPCSPRPPAQDCSHSWNSKYLLSKLLTITMKTTNPNLASIISQALFYLGYIY